MPSYLHEMLLLLFRNQMELAPGLLEPARKAVPRYTHAQIESNDLTDLQPAQYRADLVLMLNRDRQPVLAIVVEVQLRRDEEKKYTWPAYVANLRARSRCPVYLLVLAVDERVERWAMQPIELGAGSCVVPCVFGPSNTPIITRLEDAEQNVELAVLSACVHGRHPDPKLAARVASAAILVSAGVDAERSKLYLDLILKTLSEDAEQALQGMNALKHVYMSDFARRYVAQGWAESILKMLTSRFGPLTEADETRVRTASAEGLDRTADSLLSATTLQEALRHI